MLSYLVCGTPRCGSTLLCDLLDSTGVAGHPREYFWRKDVRRNARAWRVIGYRAYVARVLEEGCTDNGVFAAKVMWGYLDEATGKLRRVVGAAAALPNKDVLDLAFPNLHFVWIKRENHLAQAVSWARAAQTGKWSSRQAARRAPVFSFDQIHGFLSEIAAHEIAWQTWFRTHGLEPFTITYEALTDDVVGATRAVLEFLSLTLPPTASLRAFHAQQRDALNDEWAARYTAMIGS